jgi:putative endonuclease
MSPTDRFGNKGARAEDAAEAFLRRDGWRTLARNHRTREGEVDLVVEREGTVAFVEVRSRAPGPVSALESITWAKRRRVVRAARDFLRTRRPRATELRFDVVAVEWRRDAPGGLLIEHVPAAFDALS